jgi:succinoglycan biosynthesis transport protein ExoP
MADSTFPNSGVHAEKGQFVVLLAYAKDFIDIAIRRKWVIISCILFGLVSGGWGAWFKKDMYRSNTVILVEQQKIPEQYVPSIGGGAAERVSTITQQVLSRTNLQKVIDEFQLSSDTIKRQGYESVVEGLRKNVKIQTKASRGQLESLTISFAHEDPMVAMRVTSKLASQYIEGNIKIREQFIEGATEFLEQELALAKETLDEKEKVLSEYKLRFAGELPAQLETNLRTLDRLQLEKIRIQESLTSLHSRIELVQKSIGDYGYPPSLLQGPTKGRMGDPSVIQLSEFKKELQKMTGEFTDAYPDVISLKLQIKKFEEELAQRAEPGHEPDIVAIDPYLAELKNEQNALKLQIDKLLLLLMFLFFS